MKQYQVIGIFLTILGAVLWGVSGTAVQFLGNYRGMNLEWLVTSRLLLAGMLTVLYAGFTQGLSIFDVFKNRRDLLQLFIFGIFGIGMCQYTYFNAILIAGSGVATVLQYLAPSMIIIYIFMRHGKRPSMGEMISVMLALVGTICLMGNEGGSSLDSIRLDVLAWGTLSAVGVAVYSLAPVSLLSKYGTLPTVGFGMILSGVVAAILFHQPNSFAVWDEWTGFGYFCVIFLGTIVSFNVYLEGVKRIGAVTGSILSSVEPISAAFLGWLLLNNQFNIYGIVGMVMIIATVFIIALEKRG